MNIKRTENFKQRPALFADRDNARLVRGLKNEERIRSLRAENFSKLRNIARDAETKESQSRRHNNGPLDRWRAERALKTKIEQRKKKPIFKVGIVHHKFYSPPVSIKTKAISQPCHPRGRLATVKNQHTPPKRITRATQKRLEAKNRAATHTPAVTSEASTSKCPASVKRRLPVTTDKQESFAPANYAFKGPSGVNELPMFVPIALPQGWKEEASAVQEIQQPSSSNDDLLSLQNQWASSVQISLKLAMEKPWPTQDPSDATEFSQESAAPESTTNSSIEGSFKLRLSPEYENTEEQKNKEELQGSVPENTEANVVEADDVPMEAPPRSGTPVPASFSPYIVTSRGKDSVRKEQQARMGIRRSSANEIPTKDTVMQNLNISVEEEEQTAQYFKHLLQRETEKLNELCAEWETIKNDSDISEDAEYQINAAIGQTNLLLRKKFSRFQSLIKDCETGKGEMLVRCKDLEGFYELINREIKDCETRFLKLKILQSNGWVESESVVTKVTKKRATAVPTKPKINVKSSARSWILAARKKKMLQNFDRDTIAGQTPVEDDLSTSSVTTKTKVDSPKRTITPKKTTTPLLKRVQLSQASRNIRSPLAVIKISKMCKTPEVTLDDTISYVNSDQTPAKGILKKSESTAESDTSGPKSSRKVDFNDELVAEEFPAADVDEALQNSIDLGRALARIESYDSDDDPVTEPSDNVTLRKRLDFEDDVFDEIDAMATVMKQPEIPNIDVIPPSPINKLTPKSSKSMRRASINSSIINEAPVEELSPLVLRSRTIIRSPSPKNTRRSKRASKAGESSTSMTNTEVKENCDPNREATLTSNNWEISKTSNTEHENAKHSHRRRSTRKSVRFNPDDDCKACGETPKPKQPTTPHSRQRKRISLLGESRRESVTPLPGGDLIMFDTPAKQTPRIRRSSCK